MVFMSQAVIARETHAEPSPHESAESQADYAHAVDRLYALGQELAPLPPLADGTPAPRRKWDLAYMRILCAALGNPQETFPSVLIAGTNGKGSTAATLASILAAAGYKTGLYTSPHLVRVNERVQLLPPVPQAIHEAASGGNTEIPDATFGRLFTQVEQTAATLVASGTLPFPPSFFEVLTALAFLYYSEEKISIAVLEVGLGGRLDATNIVEPLISVITDIALDHQDYLGDTIAAITFEKAGILRKEGILVTLPQHPEANQAIGEAAVTLNLTAISAADFIPQQTPVSPSAQTDSIKEPVALPRNRYTLTLDNQPLQVDSPLPGHHQQRNIALAIATASTLRHLESYISKISNLKSYNIANSAIEEGIRNTRWPGRLEFLPPNLLLDVAHNPAGAWTLRAAIARLPESRPRTLIFSCLSDKNLTEISRILFPLFDPSSEGGRPGARGPRERDHIILAPIANPRAAKVEDLLAAAYALDIPAHAAPHLAGALAQARAVTPAEGLIIATGSVYLVGAIRDLALSEQPQSQPEEVTPSRTEARVPDTSQAHREEREVNRLLERPEPSESTA